MKEPVKKRLFWLEVVVIFLVTLFIWGHSLVPADQSSVESGRFVAWLGPILKQIKLPSDQWQTVVRKSAHMTEFALLAVVWMVTLVRCKVVSWPRKVGTVAAVCMAVAVVDETVQLHVTGRSGQISDVWVDLLGAFLGIILVTVVSGVIVLKKRRK